VNKYTVVIPTTNNLVGITDIIVEDPLISSVICENNSLEALPISNQYDSFVKSPTGIIEKITGNSSFRVDITSRIEQGKSWQLGLAIGHIFHNRNLLNFSSSTSLISYNKNNLIWASGEINSNLDVKGISYLNQKVTKSNDFFKNCIKNNVNLSIILSHENIKSFNEILNENKFLKEAIKNKKIKAIFIKNLKNFFDQIELKNILKFKTTSSDLLSKFKKYIRSIALVFIFLSFLLSAYNVSQVITPLIKLKNNDRYRALLTNLSAYRQGDFLQRVSAYFFDYYQGVETRKLNKQIVLNFLPYSNDKKLQNICVKKESSYDTSCNLNIEATNVGHSKIFLWMLRYINNSEVIIDKVKVNNEDNIEIINGMISREETISIEIKDSNKPTTLFFVYGKTFDVSIRKWLVNLSKRNTLLKSTVKRIKSLGYGYTIKKINNVKLIESFP
jgi:hypothetical protein